MGAGRLWTTRITAVIAGLLAVSATTGVLPIVGRAQRSVAHADPIVADQRSAIVADQRSAIPADLVVSLAALTTSTPRPSSGSSRPPAGRPAALVVRIPSAMSVHRRPSRESSTIGSLPAGSKYYQVGIAAWVERVSSDGRWGRVEIPYIWPRRDGWIPLKGLRRSTTHVEVQVDLSRHRVTVEKFGKVLYRFGAATGARSSPTPPGEYFVTDRIPFPAGGSFGSFAFGISGIQPNLPAGWSGGDQLAIHGTNQPSTIGTSASAGCLRVSESSLHRLLPLLQLGTPVVIHA